METVGKSEERIKKSKKKCGYLVFVRDVEKKKIEK